MSRSIDRAATAIELGGMLTLAVCFLLGASPAHGQIVNATLYGAVTDPTGAGVPEASVTAANVSTGIATRTTRKRGETEAGNRSVS